MKSVKFLLNPHTGELVVHGATRPLLNNLVAALGKAENLDCGDYFPVPDIQPRCSPQPGSVRIAGISYYSMVDGPGVRNVVFFQGCPHHCPGCKNPNTHSFDVGVDITVENLVSLLEAENPVDGITLSGGEPFAQAKECTKLVTALKKKGKHITVYSGYTYEYLSRRKNSYVRRVLSEADILIDGPYIAELKNKKLAYRGSSNQRVIDLTATRTSGKLTLLEVD